MVFAVCLLHNLSLSPFLSSSRSLVVWYIAVSLSPLVYIPVCNFKLYTYLFETHLYSNFVAQEPQRPRSAFWPLDFLAHNNYHNPQRYL